MIKKLVSTGNGNQWHGVITKAPLGEEGQDQTQPTEVNQIQKRTLLVEDQGISFGINVENGSGGCDKIDLFFGPSKTKKI